VLRTIRLDVPAAQQRREIVKNDGVKAARIVVRRSLESLGSLFFGVEGWNDVTPRNCLRKLQDSNHSPEPRLFLENDLFDERSAEEWRRFAATLVEPIAAHNVAVATITRILRDSEADPNKNPKTPLWLFADLELQRFWLKSTAFHLDFVRVVAASPEKFLHDFAEGEILSLGIDPTPAVMMSDCLVARDGRRVSAEREALRALFPPRSIPPQVDQSNVLTMRPDDPDYRAERDLDDVLLNLDAALKTRALDCIASARAIHDRWRDTPWDWMVYYAELEGFSWAMHARISGEPIRPRPKPDDEKEPEPTPRRPRPGSTGQPKPSTPGGGN
jgi:hypothetical protein